MRLASKPLVLARDSLALLDFVHRYPHTTSHVVDLPYRLCSPSAQDPANGHIWHDETGELVGFCIIQRQFSVTDCVVHPDHASLKEEMMTWAMQRLSAMAQETGSFGYLYDGEIEHDPLALKYGFERDDWDIRHLALSSSHPVSSEVRALPDGFQIRPLKGMAEVEAYAALHQAAFGTRNMTSEWRARTVQHPLYQPDLDLVIEAADGTLTAFCIGWLAEMQSVLTGQIEPLGVLPAYHRMGLGRAILEENLRRMRARGAATILIDAESNNEASQTLYESVGFREVGRTLKYFRTI